MDKNDYPSDFIDALKFKTAMNWADEHEALLQEIDRLTDMLCRMCEAMDKKYGLNISYLAGEYIDKWRETRKDKK